MFHFFGRQVQCFGNLRRVDCRASESAYSADVPKHCIYDAIIHELTPSRSSGSADPYC